MFISCVRWIFAYVTYVRSSVGYFLMCFSWRCLVAASNPEYVGVNGEIIRSWEAGTNGASEVWSWVSTISICGLSVLVRSRQNILFVDIVDTYLYFTHSSRSSGAHFKVGCYPFPSVRDVVHWHFFWAHVLVFLLVFPVAMRSLISLCIFHCFEKLLVDYYAKCFWNNAFKFSCISILFLFFADIRDS